jgi:hypothetical protein
VKVDLGRPPKTRDPAHGAARASKTAKFVEKVEATLTTRLEEKGEGRDALHLRRLKSRTLKEILDEKIDPNFPIMSVRSYRTLRSNVRSRAKSHSKRP